MALLAAMAIAAGGDFSASESTIATPVEPQPLETAGIAQAPQAPATGFAEPDDNAAGHLALGLAGIVDWSVEQPFIDVMKTARPWIGHLPDQWGGMTEHDLSEAGYLDEHGWPMAIPAKIVGISTLVLTDMPEAAVSLAGRYRLRFEGDGAVDVSGSVADVDYGDGEILFDYTPGLGAVIVTISDSDPKGIGDYVRNISVVNLANAARFDADKVFNPSWVERVNSFGLLRFMDWMNTNDSDLAHWSDRPRPDDYTYARNGAPVEIMVRLANELGADPWFNMPHLATDEFIRSFAEYVHSALDPERTAFVEFSNEVWNWQFTQAVWAEDRARERWGVENGWMQYYGMRAAQTAKLWKEVFGASAGDRLITVISTQTAWRGLEADVLNAPRWVEENQDINNPPADYVDAYAIAGYFGRVLGTPERAPLVRAWIESSARAAESTADAMKLSGAARKKEVDARRFDAAIAITAQELRDGSVTGDMTDTLADLLTLTIPYHVDVADRYNLDLIMYEGGSHVAGVGEVIDDESLTEFFVALNYSNQMGDLYADLLRGWRSLGGQYFNVYADVQQPGKWGSWGALRHLDDQNPRWEAILNSK